MFFILKGVRYTILEKVIIVTHKMRIDLSGSARPINALFNNGELSETISCAIIR